MQVCSGIFVDEVWSTCAAHQIHSLSYSLRTVRVRSHRKVIVVRMVMIPGATVSCGTSISMALFIYLAWCLVMGSPLILVHVPAVFHVL